MIKNYIERLNHLHYLFQNIYVNNIDFSILYFKNERR